MELEGVLKVIGETKAYGRNDFLKREVVVTTQEKFPQDILVEFVQDKAHILDKYAEGQEVKIGINLQGREWTSPQGEVKYFNTIRGWRIEAISGQPAQSPTQPKEDLLNEPQLPVDEDDEDDLPF